MLNLLVCMKCVRVIAVALQIYYFNSNGSASLRGRELALHLYAHLGQPRDAATLWQQSMTLFPKEFRLFGRRVAQGVCNREPILCRRYSLLERLSCNHVRRSVDQYRSNVNLYHSYENGGRADFLRFPHPSFRFSDNTLFDAGNYAFNWYLSPILILSLR